MLWTEIDEPGCYLFIDTGDLVRIPTDALASGHSPLIALKSNREPRLVRLSGNPALSSKRRTAARCSRTRSATCRRRRR